VSEREIKFYLERLNRESQSIWDKNARFWDERMGEGNQFQRQLIGPVTDRLLGIKDGESVLDIACGNGHYLMPVSEPVSY
jgi:ubiquinone/menaquinone biosynthesis C-methylase UbiE